LKEIFIDCDCHCETLRIEKHETEFWFSFWQQGFSCKEKYSFFDKLRLAIHVLKNGHGYADMVIISNNRAKELIKFLEQTNGAN